MSTGVAGATGTKIAQGESAYATRAIVRVTATPPAAAKRWFCPSLSGNATWPTSPRVIATTPGPRTPPVIPCNGDRHEAGPKAEYQGAQCDRNDTDRDQESFGPHRVQKFTAGHLANQTGDTAYAEHKTNVLSCPLLSRKVGGGNWSKSALHASQEEVEP